VRIEGRDGDVDDIAECLLRVLEASEECKCRGIVVDERNREYRLDTVGLLKLAERCSRHRARFRRFAFVCDARSLYDASFWETAAVNRGLNVRVFTSVDDALSWMGHEGARRGGAMPAA
jgi:hypothetical protein